MDAQFDAFPEQMLLRDLVIALVEEIMDTITELVILWVIATITLIEILVPSYIPAVGRFLIVCTFIEDAIRIITQWGDQLLYLHDYRHSTAPLPPPSYPAARLTRPTVPWGLTHLFLLINVLAMCSCSTLVIIRKYTEYAVFGLIGVVITQALGYGLIFDLNFFLRNLSVMGGLLMVLSDSWVRRKFAPAGLPMPSEKDRKKWIQLAGRILLILLFVGFIWSGDWGFARIVVSLFGFVACVMVAVGFKAKFSAILLVVILSVFNLVVNNFWTVHAPFREVHKVKLADLSAQLHEHHPHKDFAKYDFFQILSIVYVSSLPLLRGSDTNPIRSGGLLLLVNMGPGSFSVDEKKKVY